MKNTLVIGASLNPSRYSNMAMIRLSQAGHAVKAVGLREGNVAGITITKEFLLYENIDTITLYINAKRQPDYYNYILAIKPRRVLFNPGTENPEFYEILKDNSIHFEIACTLVLLSTNQY